MGSGWFAQAGLERHVSDAAEQAKVALEDNCSVEAADGLLRQEGEAQVGVNSLRLRA